MHALCVLETRRFREDAGNLWEADICFAATVLEWYIRFLVTSSRHEFLPVSDPHSVQVHLFKIYNQQNVRIKVNYDLYRKCRKVKKEKEKE